MCLRFMVLMALVASGSLLPPWAAARARPADETPPLVSLPRDSSFKDLSEAQRELGLGQVVLLDTYLSPNNSTLKTSFNVHCRCGDPARGIKLSTDTIAQQDREQILRSGFNASQRLIIMIPGYFSPEEVDWVREARQRWLELDSQANIIEVSWTDSNMCTYSRAVAHTPFVARKVTMFLHNLAQLGGTTLQDGQFLDRVHLIGFSLGAHIAGFVGQDLRGRVGRITGLDPAGPSFDSFDAHLRLDQSDAKLVEVLHTNSGRIKYLKMLAGMPLRALSSLPLFPEQVKNAYTDEDDAAWFGIDAQIGHVDYYANNGRVQPGCADPLHICDHKRASWIYVDLLNYESSLRRSQSSASLLELLDHLGESESNLVEINRLLAFKSPDYESFVSGSNFYTHCPEVMSLATHLSDREVLKSFKKCSIPLLNLFTSTEELVRDLKTNYGVDFDSTADSTKPRHVYYFKTSADGLNLVGDHYLLKLYLPEEPLWDSSRCVLAMDMIFDDGTKIQLDLSHHVSQTNVPERIIAVPFVHLNNSRAKDQYNNMMRLIRLHELERRDQNDDESAAGFQYTPSSDFIEVFQKLFPQKIKLTLGKPKVTSVFGTLKDMTIKMLKTNDLELAQCRLAIDMIEVHPLVYGLKRNFGALYGRDLCLEAEPSLTVRNVGEQMRRLEQPDKLVMKLENDGISSLSVGLVAALTG